MRPICVLGNANLDLVMGPLGHWPEPGTETFLPDCDLRVGGSAANTALVLKRMGVAAGLVSAAGTGEGGEVLAGAFCGPFDRMARIDLPTGVSVGLLHPGAERTFLSFTGHLAALDLDFFLDSLGDWPLAGALVLVSGGFALPALMPGHVALLDHLREAGAEVAIDPGWPGEGWDAEATVQANAWLARADHALMNDKEVRGLAGDTNLGVAMARVHALMPETGRLVVKCGREGARALWAGGAASAPVAPRDVFDTVGAGDAFNAGYLAAVAAQGDTAEALARGTEIAGRVISEFPRSLSPLSTEMA